MTDNQQLTALRARIRGALHALQADGTIDRGQFADILRDCDPIVGEYVKATEVLGDDQVLQYVTSGNAVPVTRCTVSADLLRRLLRA